MIGFFPVQEPILDGLDIIEMVQGLFDMCIIQFFLPLLIKMGIMVAAPAITEVVFELRK